MSSLNVSMWSKVRLIIFSVYIYVFILVYFFKMLPGWFHYLQRVDKTYRQAKVN